MTLQPSKVIPLPQGLMADSPAEDTGRARLAWRAVDALASPGIRRHVVVAVLAGLLGLTGLAVTMLLWRDPQLPLSLSILSGLLSMELLAAPLLCQSPQHLDLAGALTIGGLVGFLALLAFLAGGLNQPLLSLVIALPVVATVLLSPRAGVCATLSLCAAISLMLLLELRGLSPRLWPLAPQDSTLLRGAVLLLGTTATATAIWAAESRLRRIQERWKRDVRPDPVSGLLTEWQFQQRLLERLGQLPPPGTRATLFLVAIDHFDPRLQQKGRSETQELLRRVGAAIRASATDPRALAARLDTDQFALFNWCASPATVRTVYERMQLLAAATTADLPLNDGAGVTLSIGIAELPLEDSLLAGAGDRLHQAASDALASARALGGNKVRQQPDAA